jgi:hypothetical protein
MQGRKMLCIFNCLGFDICIKILENSDSESYFKAQKLSDYGVDLSEEINL